MTGEELFLNELNFHIRQGISKKDLTDLINERIKQLTLTDVSKQRGLLIAFAKYMEEDKMYARHDEANADDFLEKYSN